MATLRAFLAVEAGLRRRLLVDWRRREVVPLVRRLRAAVAADDFGAAERLVQGLTFQRTFESQQGMVEQVALNAYMLGQSFFVGGRIRDGLLASGREPVPLQVEQAVRSLGVGLERSVQQVREAASDVVHEARAGVQKAAIPGLASKLNAAVAGTGGRVVDAAANLTTSRLAAYGALVQAEELGEGTYQVNEVMDIRTCPVCVLEGQRVRVELQEVSAASKRFYHGQAITLVLAGGERISVTPNHPVLTCRGWVAAGSLDEGEDIVCCRVGQRESCHHPSYDEGPARVEDVFKALSIVRGAVVREVPVAAPDFHGDGFGGKVEVVSLHGFLGFGGQATRMQALLEVALFLALLGEAGLATQGCIGRRLGRPLSAAQLRRPASHYLGVVPSSWNVKALEQAVHGIPMEPEAALDFLHRGPGDVELRRLVRKEVGVFGGHVYNFETREGWYGGGGAGVVVHNCRRMHGRTFSVGRASQQLAADLLAPDPFELAQSRPFPRSSRAGVEELTSLNREGLEDRGWNVPPYHPGCRGVLSPAGTVGPGERIRFRPLPSGLTLAESAAREIARVSGGAGEAAGAAGASEPVPVGSVDV